MSPNKNLEIKKRLLEADMTQKQLSRQTDIGENYISLIIKGRYVPNEWQMDRIAKALNCQPEEIFG